MLITVDNDENSCGVLAFLGFSVSGALLGCSNEFCAVVLTLSSSLQIVQ
jgi:hypothetical protein